MISEASCDTEECSNAITEINNISKYILKLHNISLLFYCIFEPINAALVTLKYFFQKHVKNLINPKTFENV